MACHQLHALTEEKSLWLLKVSQSCMAPALHMQLAQLLLEIAADP